MVHGIAKELGTPELLNWTGLNSFWPLFTRSWVILAKWQILLRDLKHYSMLDTERDEFKHVTWYLSLSHVSLCTERLAGYRIRYCSKSYIYSSKTSCLEIKVLTDIADEYTSTEVKRWYQWKFKRNYECKNKYEINIRKKC